MNIAAAKILLIEDNPGDAALMGLTLARASGDFEVHHVDRLSIAQTRLARETFRVALVDLSLPDAQGCEAVLRLRSWAPHLPIVVLTSLESDDLAMQALDAGAQDYLVKDHVTVELLRRSIYYAIQRQQNAGMRRLLGKVRASEKLLAKKNRRLARLFKTAHRFVDNVSHEFRTPLTVIKEYSSLVRDAAVGPVTKEQTELLDIVGDRADDLNTMVNDMLDMSKLEAGLHSAWRKRCRITDILQRMLPNLERKAQVKIVSLEIRCDDDLPDVFCDPEKIGRVIVNLTVNAIKFSGRPGKVAITVRADAEMREVVVEIADNGAGIHRDDLEAIYARFKQLPSRSRGSTKGFGLGLNIAKELVALNFGEIRVESEVGQGSSFSFTIPMAQPREVFSRYLRRLPRSADEPGDVSLLVAEVADSTDPETADDVEALLHSVLRKRDLIFRRDPHAWIIILPAAEAGVARFHSRLGDYLEQTNRNRPFGPLPAVDLKTDSHWPLDEQVEQVLERIDAIMVTGEPSHVCIS